MDRRNAFAVTIDADKLTKAEAIYLLKAIAAGKAEMSFSGDGVVWVHESEHDTFISMAAQGKASVHKNLPTRYYKVPADSNEVGILTRDNKEKYVLVTPENITKADKLVAKADDTIVTEKYLSSLTLTKLKAWVKERGIADQVDLRKKKSDIILQVLKILYGEE